MSIERTPPTEAQLQVAATLTAGLVSALNFANQKTPGTVAQTALPEQIVELYYKVLENLQHYG